MKHLKLFSAFILCFAWSNSSFSLDRFTIADLADKVMPAVVNISAEENDSSDISGTMANPFSKNGKEQAQKDYKLRSNGIQRKTQYNIGSGVIISQDGFVITNYHVVELAKNIKLTTFNNKVHYADLVGFDEKTDLALLKIKSDSAGNFSYVNLADSNKIRVGEVVIAVGNPYGLEGSISMGIVSARNRNIGTNIYDDFLQTDASINPGNSGGPLFNLDGDVIGINTAILSNAGGSEGVGFSIPSNTVKVVIDQLKKNGKVIRGWLGIQAQEIDEEIAKALKLDSLGSVLVSEVVENSPAFKANVKEGDVILAYNDKKIESLFDLPRMVSETDINSEVKITVLRNGKKLDLHAVIVSTQQAENIELGNLTVEARVLNGIYFADINQNLKEEFQISAYDGVVVVGVDRNVAKTDLVSGDVILQVNQKDVKQTVDLEKIISKSKEDSFLVFVNRRGSNIFTVIRK